jgi:hypothetical protein
VPHRCSSRSQQTSKFVPPTQGTLAAAGFVQAPRRVSTPPRKELLAGLCDDAALFPPGNLPLAYAVPAQIQHLASEHRDLVGPFIVSAGECPRSDRSSPAPKTARSRSR